MELELDGLPKGLRGARGGGGNTKTLQKNLLPQNSSFEVYFRGKTQPNNSKGTSFRNCIQKPSIVQLTKTFRLRSAPAFPHFCVTLTV